MKGFIGLGSNLGDRRGHLRAAIAAMRRKQILPTRLSSIWETEPVDVDKGGWFLNMVAEVRVSHRDPIRLLDALQAIEESRGRRRGRRNAARTLDLDILMLDGVSSGDPRLVLPHPRLWERRFVLEPLAELEADRRDPGSDRTVASECDRIRWSSVVFRRGRLGILRPAGTRARADASRGRAASMRPFGPSPAGTP